MAADDMCVCGHDWTDHLYGGPCLAEEVVDELHPHHNAADPTAAYQDGCCCLRFDPVAVAA